LNVPPHLLSLRTSCSPLRLASHTMKAQIGFISQNDQPIPFESSGHIYHYVFIIPLIRESAKTGKPTFMDKYEMLGGGENVHYSVQIPGQYAVDGMKVNYFIRTTVNHQTNEVKINYIGQSSVDRSRLSLMFENFRTWGCDRFKQAKQRYNERKQAKAQQPISQGETTEQLPSSSGRQGAEESTSNVGGTESTSGTNQPLQS